MRPLVRRPRHSDSTQGGFVDNESVTLSTMTRISKLSTATLLFIVLSDSSTLGRYWACPIMQTCPVTLQPGLSSERYTGEFWVSALSMATESAKWNKIITERQITLD
jgi:hypothetical protein